MRSAKADAPGWQAEGVEDLHRNAFSNANRSTKKYPVQCEKAAAMSLYNHGVLSIRAVQGMFIRHRYWKPA